MAKVELRETSAYGTRLRTGRSVTIGAPEMSPAFECRTNLPIDPIITAWWP
jgi:hypothetical protein